MKKGIKKLNNYLSEKYADKFKHTPSVICFLIHKIYPSKKDVVAENGTVAEGITQSDFEQFIVFFKNRNFIFIDETDLINKKLDPLKKYIYLTFDDGYFNNFLALEILNKYNAKATFYLSTNHCRYEKAYWWDVLYKNRIKQNQSIEKISKETEYFYTLNWKEQDRILLNEFGPDVFKSDNDLMRPMSEKELIKFANNPGVLIGNHTDNHLNLEIYTESEIKDSITEAEEFIVKTVQRKPQSIAYPYGFYSDKVLKMLPGLGYPIGQTCNQGKNQLDHLNLLELKRNFLSGFYDIEEQCKNVYVNYSLFDQLKKTLLLK